MKKIILLISLVSLLFISCENSLSKIENPSLAENSTNTPAVTTRPSEDGKTYITFGDISFENESRTINPVYNRDDLTALYIKGMETTKVTPTTKPTDYTTLFGLYNPKATSYEDLCTKTFEITPGVWNFILYATLYDFEFSGMTTVEVKPGITHSLNFTLATTNTSLYPYGIIDITIDFTGNADRVVATLKEKSTSTTARITKTYTPTDTKNPISTVEGETYKRINFKTANTSSSSSGGVTAGKYYLLFEFFQDGFDEPINTVENIVRVENNFTTKKTLNLDLDELYTITYSYWEGSGEFYENELENLTFTPASTVLPSVYSRKSETFTLPTPSLPGYTFDAWYKDTDFTEENKITQITQGSIGNLELYANFTEGGGGGNNFYVDTNGDDEASGLDAEHPLKTIMTAISKMNNSNTDYVINVMGDLWTDNFAPDYDPFEITDAINGKAKSITFRGNADSGNYNFDGQSDGDGTTVMKVTTSVPIILEGITVRGGCADDSHLGGAIYIGEESTVILGQGTIINGGGDHGCGSAIYVAASDNGGVTKAGTLIMKDNAVVNADEFGEIYLCTGATIKVASTLTGQSSFYDSNIDQTVTSPIVAKITPQVYAENTPVIALTDDAPATLTISDVYEKFAVFEEDTTSWLITNEGKLAKASNGGNVPDDFVLVAGAEITTPPQNYSSGGSFAYASSSDPVIVPSFYMCKHEVTQEEYEKYCCYGENSPSETNNKNEYPAYYISWYDAIVYCNLRSKAENLQPVYSIKVSTQGSTEKTTNPTNWDGVISVGSKYRGPDERTASWEWVADYPGYESIDINPEANGYRLPTAAEWEYAARGGNGLQGPQTEYSGSSEIEEVSFDDYDIHRIQLKKANTLGVFDMSGSVSEWIWDVAGEDYRTVSPLNDSIDYTSSASPYERNHGYNNYIGFRVVRKAN